MSLADAQGYGRVRSFYRQNPFPGYRVDKYAVRDDLVRAANPYTLLLDLHIPLDARVLDLGCGTGQLTCLLALRGREVVGVDFSEPSLRKAAELKERLGLDNVELRCEDVRTVERRAGETFDVILCNGVVPCLADAPQAVGRICRDLASPGTLVVLGLYHSYGRTAFRLRRFFARASRRDREPASVRIMLVKDEPDAEKLASWVADQIHPPVEACYRAAEVHAWLTGNGVQWLRSLPPMPGDPDARTPLFADRAEAPRVGLRWWLAELAWCASLRDTGGYFVVLGRKAAA